MLCILKYLSLLHYIHFFVLSRAENGNGNTTVSLWRVCFNNICDFREFNEEIITSEDKASQLLNATLACVVISTIIVISSLFTICCRNRCASGTVLAFASVFMVAAVGCFVYLMLHEFEKISTKFEAGFYIACCNVLIIILAAVGTSCMQTPTRFRYQAVV